MINARDFSSAGVSCLSPLRLRNKYDGNWYTVPCRHCAACVEKRRRRIVSRLETLRANSKSCFFFTLTYDELHVPRLFFDTVQLSADGECYSALHRRRCPYSVSLKGVDFSSWTSTDWCFFDKGSIDTNGNALPSHTHNVLRKKDLQLFFKRFRKAFNNALPTYHFKYYAIGEYGSQSFRPHYHGLIYCDAPIDTNTIHVLVRDSWRYGRSDVQSVKTSASSYCASYINSTACVPAFLRVRDLAQFEVCSNGSFFEMWPEQVEKFVETEFFNIPLLHPVQTGTGMSLAAYSRSTRLQFYPVTPGFHTLDYHEVRRRMSIFRDAAEEQGTNNPWFLSHSVTSTSKGAEYGSVCESLLGGTPVPYSDMYAMSICADSSYKRICTCMDNKEFMTVYTSKRIFDFVRKYLAPSQFNRVVDTIISFYRGKTLDPFNIDEHYTRRLYSTQPTNELQNSSFALFQLRQQYQAMEDNVTCVDDLGLYYSQYNCFSSYDQFLKWSDANANIICDDDQFCFSDLLEVSNQTNYDTIKSFAELKPYNTIKHKERNAYWQLQATGESII